MINLRYHSAAIIALIVCHVTSNVASTANNAHHDHILSTGHPSASDLEHDLEDLKDQVVGSQHLHIGQDASSDPVDTNNDGDEDDISTSESSIDIEWNHLNSKRAPLRVFKRAPMRMLRLYKRAPIRQFRNKRDIQSVEKRLNYDRMGKRSYDIKRFGDAMRLGKRNPHAMLAKRMPPGGTSSFTDALRLGKRYGDAMRLGKRAAMDTMRLGKRLDAMRLGKKSAMDTMRLGKRMDEMRFGKRMDQMRLGKRNFNAFMLDDKFLHSLDNNNEKRMSDVMRLGKRSGAIHSEAETHGEIDPLEDNVEEDHEENSFEVPKRMSDLMRLGKRGVFGVYGKRMSDLMRLGKRMGSVNRVGKRHFMDDEIRFGKRAFMDEMRMGKRMGDVMRLGKRAPDGMRLGKRSADYVDSFSVSPFEFEDTLNDEYEDDEEL